MCKLTAFQNKHVVPIFHQAYILITITAEFFPPVAGLFAFTL